MIPISKIITLYDFMGDEWMVARRGKITASAMGKLISDNSHKGVFTQGAMSYLRNLAGERITKKPHKGDFSNNYTDHGNRMEPEAIRHFCRETGLTLLSNDNNRGDSHRVIMHDDYCLATPDGLVTKYDADTIFDDTGKFLKAETLEVKCPTVFHRFISLFECKTPQDLKKVEKDYYWQKLTQVEFAGGLQGWWAVYNKEYPKPMNIILFEKMKLMDDIKKLNLTLHFAKKEIDRLVSLLEVKI